MEDKIVRPLPANGCSAELVVTRKAIDDAQDFVWVDIKIEPNQDVKSLTVDTSAYDDDPMLFKISGDGTMAGNKFTRDALVYQQYDTDKDKVQIKVMTDNGKAPHPIYIQAKMNVNTISKLKGGD